MLLSIVDHSVQVDNSVGTVSRRDTVKHGSAVCEGEIDAEVISFSFGNNYLASLEANGFVSTFDALLGDRKPDR